MQLSTFRLKIDCERNFCLVERRTLFEVLDDDKSGFVALTQIEQW